MPENCGLVALKGIKELKNASMFTLLHLARDNGLELFFCKVDIKDLPLVKRPAILHANNHFVLAEDGKPLEEANYTGWVLTPKPIGIPLPYSLAKQITGGKKGGDILGPIVTGIASIVNPILGAAVGAGFAAHKVTGGAGVTGAKGEFWRIPVGGALGYLGGQAPGAKTFGLSNTVLAGGLGAAQEIPGAVKSGNYLSPILGGLGAAAGQKFTSGASVGFDKPATGLGNQISNAFKGGVNSLLGQGGTGSTGALSKTTPAMSLKTGGVGNVFGQQLPGTGSTFLATNAATQSIPSLASSTSATSEAGKGLVGGLVGSLVGGMGKDLLKLGAAGAASQIGKPPEYKPDSLAAYDKASQFLGGKTLPPATTEQLNKYLTMTIPDLKSELLGPQAANRSMLELDKQYEGYLAQVQRAAANAGQSIQTSSEAMKQHQEVQRQWADAKANLWAELEQKATQDAINIHRWSLEQSIQQGQFDVTSAMELAAMMNLDQELKATIEQQNYEGFQNIIGDILGSDFSKQSEEQNGSGQKTGLSSTLGRA